MVATRPTSHSIRFAVVCLAASILLTGCMAEDPFTSLPTAEPSVPVTYPAHGRPDSTRLLGSDDSGRSYYVARWYSADERMTCLVVLTPDGTYATGCSSQLPITVDFDGANATLYASTPPTLDSDELIGGFVELTQ
jgi:hypothetical protein